MRLFSYLAYLGAASAQDDCSDPSGLENGSFVRNGNSADFSCNAGFCFEGERTRTLTSNCENGLWQSVGTCVSCDECVLPNLGSNAEVEWIEGTFDAKVTCVDGVIEPGTDNTETTISCIEGGRWNRDAPICSRPSVINCEDNYMEAVIDKNMLRAKGWSGDSGNIFLAGHGQMIMDMGAIDPECFSVEDGNGNYRLRIAAPFMGKCGTSSNIQGQDYLFSNKVQWRMETSFSVKEANVLDFQCVYKGVFMAGLPHKVKLAINTKQYEDEETGESFTVSMSVYDRANFTGLVDNIPILHRGKRYFVDLHLHNRDMGTPYLKHCYGSNNYVSEEELKEKYRMQTSSSSIRNMIINGCPAPKTLVNLEESPNTYQSRFSFMFPKIGRGIADLQFVYLHCEIEMKQQGYAPLCDDKLFDQVIKRNFAFANKFPGAGKGLLGGNGIGQRSFGGMGNEKLDAITERQCKLAWMRKTPRCLARAAQQEAGRKRRAASLPVSVGFGPLVVPDEDSIADEHPSTDQLSQVLDGSNVYVSEVQTERIEDVIREEIIELTEDIAIEEVEQLDQIEIIRNQRKQRKIIIITCMAGGCILLFALSVFISSRVSCVCYKDSRKNSPKNKISTDVLASQIQKELSSASNI
jgi:hypothetical protein